MNKSLTQKEIQDFIRSFSGDLTKLAFQGSPFPTVTVQELLEQIDGFQRSEKKLPSWYSAPNTLFPPKLNLEQTSSEITAEYKASLVAGNTIADLTGGFGVDAFAFSKKFDVVMYFEKNTELALLAAYNFQVLGVKNIEVTAADGLEAITDKSFDVIYIDPARRDDSKGKVFRLSDADPNVSVFSPYLLERCTTLLVKTSPMLDITEGLRELKQVAEIHVVAVQNEVKEVLWVLKNEHQSHPMVTTVNLGTSEPQTFSFQWDSITQPTYSDPKSYIYEPNAALLKSGGMNHLCDKLSISKLAPNAHLFTSEELLRFPGRSFRLLDILPYNKKSLSVFKKEKANITTRDFPLSVAQIRKKWQILEGGDGYLFFTTLLDGNKVCLVTEKI